MQLVIKSAIGRRILLAIEIAAFVLVAGWIAKASIAQVVARTLDVQHLRRAIKLDPGNAQYHLTLGRLYEYVVPETDPQKAMEEFRRAAGLSPYDPEPWLNLAAAAEFQGNTAEAEKYLERANYLAPNLPLYQWPIGNFYLLHGNTREAFRHLKVVLAGTREYDQVLFSTAWKASGNADQIVEQLIPRDLPAEFSYLYYLLAHQQYLETQPVWKRIMAGPDKFSPPQASGYIDSLINAHRPGDAFQVWTDLERKGLVKYVATGPQENLLTNGDFEDEMLNMGFTWRIAPVESVYAGVDTSTYHSASHALLVQFTGKQNLDYRQVYQYVKVSPGRSYRLQAFLKTEGITTDSGPRLEVRDAYDPGALDKFTDNLTDSTNGWMSLLLDFKTGAKTELLVVSLTRLPSQKLDNLVAGKVWVDDVRMTPLHE